MELANIPWNLVIPIFIFQVIMQVASLISLVRSDEVQRGNKIMWAMIIVLLSMMGPVLYWTLGREVR
ncbi:PLDc N-terminal domain-containing protein [Desulfosporosinus shakirovi]|uniref:PLDc N-terminal domain-containing protein n=1 Tax=Desulfosporosinus shakirovi TaxID=2885154 RepID=UPI001E4700E1|nr:PLDc N-terminal domain-containing protein [Desulfosporosinus sp. SRJS8]MCB8818545.1 PLDc N-terminal domain-containing protein [Desulfosporosinus sp. SRJS8]